MQLTKEHIAAHRAQLAGKQLTLSGDLVKSNFKSATNVIDPRFPSKDPKKDYSLRNAVFNNANCSYGIFEAADLTNATITGSNFSEANFEGAVCRNMKVTKTDLRAAKFMFADLRKAHFDPSHAGNYSYQEGHQIVKRQASFVGADLRGAKFSEKMLHSMKNVEFTGAIFSSKEENELWATLKRAGAIVDAEPNIVPDIEQDIFEIRKKQPTPPWLLAMLQPKSTPGNPTGPAIATKIAMAPHRAVGD